MFAVYMQSSPLTQLIGNLSTRIAVGQLAAILEVGLEDGQLAPSNREAGLILGHAC